MPLNDNYNHLLIDGIKSLLDITSSDLQEQKDCYILMNFILRTLKQFKLDGSFIGDVISEIALRKHNAIASGKVIKYPKAWFR
ncbi:MAG: hypothetical protein AAF383_16065 [Cyanobacteria bacterium P01_A01_bin.83]